MLFRSDFDRSECPLGAHTVNLDFALHAHAARKSLRLRSVRRCKAAGIAAIGSSRSEVYGLNLRAAGQSGLVQPGLLLTRNLFASAEACVSPFSEFPQISHSPKLQLFDAVPHIIHLGVWVSERQCRAPTPSPYHQIALPSQIS